MPSLDSQSCRFLKALRISQPVGKELTGQLKLHIDKLDILEYDGGKVLVTMLISWKTWIFSFSLNLCSNLTHTYILQLFMYLNLHNKLCISLHSVISVCRFSKYILQFPNNFISSCELSNQSQGSFIVCLPMSLWVSMSEQKVKGTDFSQAPYLSICTMAAAMGFENDFWQLSLLLGSLFYAHNIFPL